MGRAAVTNKTLHAAALAPSVRAALRAKAARMLPRAQREALKAGAREFAGQLHVTSGVRPGTKATQGLRRPYARVEARMSDDQRAADSAATQTRQQILRRAARA